MAITNTKITNKDLEALGMIDISRTRGNYDFTDTREDLVFLIPAPKNSIKEFDYRSRYVIRFHGSIVKITRVYYYAVGQGAHPPYGCWRRSENDEDNLFNGVIETKEDLVKILNMVLFNGVTEETQTP